MNSDSLGEVTATHAEEMESCGKERLEHEQLLASLSGSNDQCDCPEIEVGSTYTPSAHTLPDVVFFVFPVVAEQGSSSGPRQAILYWRRTCWERICFIGAVL